MRVTHFPVLENAMELTDRFVFNLKEGIDNPAMDIAEDAERVSGPLPRVCVLKREEGENFGFHLRVERGRPGHVVRHVDTLGVAERAGLRDGDRLLEVNELFVDDLGHVEVAGKIQVSGPQLCLLVLDGEEYEQAVAQGRDLRELAGAQRGEGWKPPRLCHITRDPVTGLGFSILPVEGEKGKFTISPVTGGPAEKAGVRKADRLIWINGAMACELTHSAISKMVKKCSDHMTVLVIDSESEKSYVRRRMLILPAMADAQSMPHRPRRLHLEQGPDGYGFYLRQEKTSAGRLVHMLRDVEAGSPAELAGVKDGELLLEVNGESTEHLSHEDVVSLFRQSGQQVTITTMTLHGQDFYTKLGLSPLLFTEEDAPAKEQKEKPAAVVKLAAPLAEAQEELRVEANVRLCVLQRGTVGFGFHLGCIQQKPGTFHQPGGSAESSGLLQGDVIVEVNGQNVEDECLEDVILLMKKGETSLSLLVVDRPGYEWMKKNGKPITAEKVVKASEVKEDVSPSPTQPTL
ncbi:LOW QUALITY PROTEIN: PDZ domain containing 3b [Colossoma macropomum]|uniref:LOW QUALITY PROTEIN: PDZ domain containing 3b n=1 Tax=Colossoma macropomum TaxID=42526 RepID=UPI001864093E|nr:LOW QUALITY PROTEIN: PDZ domain containing 3b [Colossoma macropomum]